MRKVGIAIGLLAIICLGYWWFSPSPTPQESSVIAIKSQTLESPEIDTDKDGLRDWEEVLWHSNPNIADTDKDGTPDGAEVMTQRDPNKAGPDDIIVTKVSDDATLDAGPHVYTYDSALGENLTDRAALNLTANYLLLRSNKELTSTDKADLVNSTVSNTVKLLSSPKIFSQSSLKLVPSNQESLRKYYNDLATIIEANNNLSIGSEMSVMEQANREQSIAVLAPLRKIGTDYETIANVIAKLEVPSPLSSKHLALANSLSEIGWSLEMMGNQGTDPTTALIGLKVYQSSYDKLTRLIVPELHEPIKSGYVSLEPGDAALLFLQ